MHARMSIRYGSSSIHCTSKCTCTATITFGPASECRGLEIGVRRLARVTVQPIRYFGDPVLRTPADPVVTFDKELRNLVKNLLDTMKEANGAGLAAPQIGVGLRVFAFHVEDITGHLINPVLEFPDEEEQTGDEGCLSLPGLYFDTKRRLNVIAKGFNESGDPLQIVGTGSMARCLQHETDHLDGVIFIDRLDPQARKAALREIRKAEWYDPARIVVKTSPHATSSPFGIGR